jgi:PAS domain S-box-containing protein
MDKKEITEELLNVNRELIFQNQEKEKRAAELLIANRELAFQNQEKQKRAEELAIANQELIFQNNEKERRSAELTVANRELAFQNAEKEKRAAELRIINDRLSFHIENTPLGFIEWDHQLHLKSWSKRAEEIFGWNEKELLAVETTVLSTVYEEDFLLVNRMINQLIKGEVSRNRFQYRSYTKDKKLIWCESFNSVMQDQDAGIITIMSLVEDITDRKDAERQKEFDRNNLKALLNNTNDLMWSVNRDFEIITSNQAFDEMVKKMSGMQVIEGVDILENGFSSQQSQRFRKYYERALAGESFREVEYSFFPVESWSEVSYYPIFEDKFVVGTACFSRDITDQKLAENHLRLLESVITNAKDAVLITESELIDHPGPRIIYVNKAFTEMTGYKAGEVIGKTPRLLQGPKTDRKQLDKIRNALVKQRSVEVELVNYKKNGEEFWVNFAVVPVADKNGRFTHCVSIQRDVSTRRRAEEIARNKLERLVAERTKELKAALRKEKEIVEMKNKFVSIASHEFRTPLSTISFAAESIRNYFHRLSEEDILNKVIKIEDQAMHMSILLEDILTLGKSSAGKIIVKKMPLNLKEFIESLIGEVNSTMKERREINFRFSCSNVNVNADDKLLRNIFNNLLTNAIKFSDVTTPIVINVSDSDENILISVADNGIGINEDDIATIFESFQRGSNVSTIPGTGLGLSILKKAVDLMEGVVRVESIIGKGSTFSVMLPIK